MGTLFLMMMREHNVPSTHGVALLVSKKGYIQDREPAILFHLI